MRRLSRVALAALMVAGYMGSQAVASAHAATTPPGPLPTVTVGSVSIREGDSGSSNVSVPINLSAPAAKTVSVSYSVEGGTATAGSDFVAKTGKVSIGKGAISKSIVVKTYGDLYPEADETVIVRITSATNAIIGTGAPGGITIQDDDSGRPPLPTVLVGDVSVVEGDSGPAAITVPVNLSTPAVATTTVSYAVRSDTAAADPATAGSDFLATTGKLTMKAGSETGTISVTVDGDTTDEPNETVAVDVTGVTNAQSSAASDGTVTIDNDDGDSAVGQQVSIGDVSVVKADVGNTQMAYMPVTLSQPATSRVVVDFYSECEDPTDVYTGPTGGSVTFLAGQRSKSIPFHIASDQAVAGSATFVKGVTVAGGPATLGDDEGVGTVIDRRGGLPELPLHGVELESVNSKDQLAKEPPGGPCSPLGHYGSFDPTISGDGRYVAFASDATNLVPGDNNGAWDVFVHDRVTGTTVRASVASDGSETSTTGEFAGSNVGADSPAISANGRFVSFYEWRALGDVTATQQLYVHDLVTGQTEDISVGPDGQPVDGVTNWPATMSADGRYITFWACSPNNGSDFVSPNPDPSTPDVATTDHNGDCDVFVRDRTTETTTLVSQSFDGAGADGSFPIISENGQFVSFEAASGHLVPGDTNGCEDVFVRDLVAGTTERINVTTGGAQGQMVGDECPPFVQPGGLSADGRYATFQTSDWVLSGQPGPTDWGTNGNHTYVRDRLTGTTTQVDAAGSQFTTYPGISADGRYISYECLRCDPVAMTVEVKDMSTGLTREVGVLPDGTLPDGNQRQRMSSAVMSSDGSYIVFTTDADNLVPRDSNEADDVFLQRLH